MRPSENSYLSPMQDNISGRTYFDFTMVENDEVEYWKNTILEDIFSGAIFFFFFQLEWNRRVPTYVWGPGDWLISLVTHLLFKKMIGIWLVHTVKVPKPGAHEWVSLASTTRMIIKLFIFKLAITRRVQAAGMIML